MKTSNSNSKQRRKRKSSSSSLTSTGTTSAVASNTTAAAAAAVPNMNESTSEFVDYLSHVNNETGMSEESLLLSPILDAFQGNITQQRGSSTSSSKRLRSSARLKRRQVVLSNQDDENEGFDQCEVNPIGAFDLNQSIPEHDVFIAGSSQVFSPLAISHGHGGTNRSLDKLVEEQQEEEMEEDKVNKVNLLKGALDTSASPSLGLGSVGSSLDSCNSRDLSYASCQSSATHGDDSIGHNDSVEKGINLALQIEEKDGTGATSHGDKVDDGDDDDAFEGISFDSVLSHGTEESLQDSIEQYPSQRHETHQDEMGQKLEKLKHSNSIEMNESCDGQTQSHSTNSNHNQSRSRVTQSPLASNMASVQTLMHEESDATPTQSHLREDEEGSTDQKDQASTPTTDFKQSKSSVLTPTMGEATPSKSTPEIRLGLTPRLKRLRAKMIRESLGGLEERSSGYEEDKRSPSTIKKSDSIGMATSLTPPNEITVGSELNLTPALKSFRAKLYRDSISIAESERTEDFASHSNFDSDLNGDGSSVGQELINTPNDSSSKKFAKFIISSRASSGSKASDQLSLTPALKAFRMKLMNSTLSPLEDTPQSHESLPSSSNGGRQQFLSPSLRPSTSTFATSGSSRRTRRVVFEEDDSYLEQPKDLSSAKKNLNAQSSALVERLRGAAHKRMISITRSRDSLAAKECLHLEKLDEVPGNGEEGEDGELRVGVEEAKKIDLKRRPRIASELIGVPVVQKRPATVPISPKLGTRRSPLSIKPSVRSNNTFAKVIPRTTPKSVENKHRDIPKVKRRPKTIPKSPLLGARRKTDQSSTTLKSSAKIVLKSPSTSPVGLGFLVKTPSYESTSGEENSAPFTLHSSIRATKRAEFEACRVLNEQLRNQEVKKERERLLNEKYKELGGLKEKLR